MNVLQVLNTNGVAKRLGCTRTWIHKLVSAGKLKAYVYNENGVLVEHRPDQKRQGQGFYFFTDAIERYQNEKQRRSKGRRAKNQRTITLRGEQAPDESHL